jgi:hypothetical protein
MSSGNHLFLDLKQALQGFRFGWDEGPLLRSILQELLFVEGIEKEPG